MMKAFFKSQMNLSGLAAIAALLPGLLMQYSDHVIGLSAVVSTVSFAVIKILLPDNAVLRGDVDKLVADGIAAYVAANPASPLAK